MAGHIPLTWNDVLLELAATPARQLCMQDLAERVVLSRTRVSRVVDELERAGLVERRPDASDRRATLATLTGRGRQRLRAAAPALHGVDRHFMRHLSDGERRRLTRLLDKVRAAAEA